MFSGQVFIRKCPNLRKVSILFTRKNGVKIVGVSLVRAVSGEFCEGCSPARNRAVSSAVAVSAQLARAAAKTTVKVIRMVAIILIAATDTLLSGYLSTRGLVAAGLGRIVDVDVSWIARHNANEREPLRM